MNGKRDRAEPPAHTPPQQQSVDFATQELHNEVEHLKNTLIGLNEKLIVFNDQKQDLEQHKTFVAHSEQARADLQQHIQSASS